MDAGPPRRSAAEIARWNDRTTPRRMLETFFFAIYCYDLAPELIVNAIDCLDYSEIGNDVERTRRGPDGPRAELDRLAAGCRPLRRSGREDVDGERVGPGGAPTHHVDSEAADRRPLAVRCRRP